MKRSINFFRVASVAILSGVVTLNGCGKSDEGSTSSTPSAASPRAATSLQLSPSAAEPSANASIPTITVSLATGPLLSQVNNQQMIHPSFSFTPPEVDSALLFATLRNDDKNTTAPLILKKIGTEWKIAEVPQSLNQEWVYAAAVPPRKEVWAILDAVDADSAAAQMTLLCSRDGGMTWTGVAGVKKPAGIAEYAGFSLAASGVGRLSMHVDDDSAAGIPHGYYHYKTSDGGKTWTGPTYEADDVIDGDSMKDVDSLSEAIKALETPTDTAK